MWSGPSLTTISWLVPAKLLCLFTIPEVNINLNTSVHPVSYLSVILQQNYVIREAALKSPCRDVSKYHFKLKLALFAKLANVMS